MDYTSREYWNGIIKMSLSKFFILRVLYTQSMHGYEIARTVAQVTNGCCAPILRLPIPWALSVSILV